MMVESIFKGENLEWELDFRRVNSEFQRMLDASEFPTVWSESGETLANELLDGIGGEDKDLETLIARYIVAICNKENVLLYVYSEFQIDGETPDTTYNDIAEYALRVMRITCLYIEKEVMMKADKLNMNGCRIIEHFQNLVETGEIYNENYFPYLDVLVG